jgi:MFS family permease
MRRHRAENLFSAEPASGKGLRLVFRALRHRNFRLFACGQLISLIGTWMQSVALSWLVYRITNSSFLLGLTGFVSQIPVVLLAPIGGMVADRYNRHRVIVGTQTSAMVLALLLAALTLGGHVQIWQILVIAALFGAVNAFDIPGRQAFLIEMVGKEDLLNAIALNSSMFNAARVVGPAVAGLLVAGVGEGWCFLLNGVSYIAVIIGLLMMRLARRTARETTLSAREHVVEGFQFVRRTRPVLAIILLLGLVSVMGVPYSVLMPIFADQVLHHGARGLGILMGATGVGAVLGALTLAARTSVRGLGRMAAAACLGFGGSLILFSASRSFWVSTVLLAPVGYCMMLQMACCNTLVQSMVPDELRGRVMAVYSMMFMGMAPLGSLMAGTLGHNLGAPWTVALGGMVCMVGGAVYWTQLSQLRQEARQLMLAHGMYGGEPPGPLPPREA